MTDENTSGGFKEIVRMISVKAIGPVPEFEAGETYKPLARIYGMATGVKRGVATYGEYAKLLGQFEMVNISTGEITPAPACILPPPMNDVIASAVETGNSGVQFAYEIGVKPGVTRPGKSRAAYEWVTKNLIEQTASDPLASLRGTVKALPAPTAEKKTAKK